MLAWWHITRYRMKCKKLQKIFEKHAFGFGFGPKHDLTCIFIPKKGGRAGKMLFPSQHNLKGKPRSRCEMLQSSCVKLGRPFFMSSYRKGTRETSRTLHRTLFLKSFRADPEKSTRKGHENCTENCTENWYENCCRTWYGNWSALKNRNRKPWACKPPEPPQGLHGNFQKPESNT